MNKLVDKNEYVSLVHQEDGFFRVTVFPELSYNIMKLIKALAKSKYKGMTTSIRISSLLDTRVVVTDIEDAREMYKLYSLLGDVMKKRDFESAVETINDLQQAITFLRETSNLISRDIPDMVHSNINNAEYLQKNDLIVSGKFSSKDDEIDETNYELHEIGHKIDRKRIADRFDKELFAVENSMKGLMGLGMYNWDQHTKKIREAERVMINENIENVLDDDNVSLAERIVMYLEQKYRNPITYDDYVSGDTDNFYRDTNVEEFKEGNERYQMDKSQGFTLWDVEQTPKEIEEAENEESFLRGEFGFDCFGNPLSEEELDRMRREEEKAYER